MRTTSRDFRLLRYLPFDARAIVVGVVLIAATSAIASARSRVGYRDASGDATAAASSGADLRLREGATLTDRRGYFKRVGDRLAFYPEDGSPRLVVLENLNLERIANKLDEYAEPPPWSVSGTVTEFRGINYLLVSRAVLKSTATRREL